MVGLPDAVADSSCGDMMPGLVTGGWRRDELSVLDLPHDANFAGALDLYQAQQRVKTLLGGRLGAEMCRPVAVMMCVTRAQIEPLSRHSFVP